MRRADVVELLERLRKDIDIDIREVQHQAFLDDALSRRQSEFLQERFTLWQRQEEARFENLERLVCLLYDHLGLAVADSRLVPKEKET